MSFQLMVICISGYCIGLSILTGVQINDFFKNKKIKESVIYCLIVGISLVIGSLLIARIHVPSPVTPFIFLFRSFGKWLLGK